MITIHQHHPHPGLAILSVGFRPFFLLGALWACVSVPIFLALLTGRIQTPMAFDPIVWHAHEMTFGFGAAAVAGFLLTAIANWTGRPPLQGAPLALLALLWLSGRVAVFLSAAIGAVGAAALDLAFPTVFAAVIAREILAGKNWRNMPMLVALIVLLLGNLLTHLEAAGLADAAGMGNRLGVATLLLLIALIGGRIIPSFTRNWLAQHNPGDAPPTPSDPLDQVVLAVAVTALTVWAIAPEAAPAPWLELAAGLGLALRLSRWRGGRTLEEPLLWILHLGYGWLAVGLLLLGVSGLAGSPQTAALHVLTVGAIGTMTLAVMTRASLGHTGRPLTAGPGTRAIYALITLAAFFRPLAPFAGEQYAAALTLAGAAWSGAYGLYVLVYAPMLLGPRVREDDGQQR